MITKQIPEFISKYCNLNDKDLFWEMAKLEIRASTIIFAKNKAKQKRNEAKDLILRLNQLQEMLRSNFSAETKLEMDRVKKELAKIVSKKNRGGVTRRYAYFLLMPLLPIRNSKHLQSIWKGLRQLYI